MSPHFLFVSLFLHIRISGPVSLQNSKLLVILEKNTVLITFLQLRKGKVGGNNHGLSADQPFVQACKKDETG